MAVGLIGIVDLIANKAIIDEQLLVSIASLTQAGSIVSPYSPKSTPIR